MKVETEFFKWEVFTVIEHNCNRNESSSSKTI